MSCKTWFAIQLKLICKLCRLTARFGPTANSNPENFNKRLGGYNLIGRLDAETSGIVEAQSIWPHNLRQCHFRTLRKAQEFLLGIAELGT